MKNKITNHSGNEVDLVLGHSLEGGEPVLSDDDFVI